MYSKKSKLSGFFLRIFSLFILCSALGVALGGCTTTSPSTVSTPNFSSGVYNASIADIAPHPAAQEYTEQAMMLLSTPYKWGGNTLSEGFDCSGLIVFITKEISKNYDTSTQSQLQIPRVARDQAQSGRAVSQPWAVGDLVFFNTRGFANSHVGIYIGNGRFIHAPATGKKIRVENLNSSYWSRTFVQTRRLL